MATKAASENLAWIGCTKIVAPGLAAVAIGTVAKKQKEEDSKLAFEEYSKS